MSLSILHLGSSLEIAIPYISPLRIGGKKDFSMGHLLYQQRQFSRKSPIERKKKSYEVSSSAENTIFHLNSRVIPTCSPFSWGSDYRAPYDIVHASPIYIHSPQSQAPPVRMGTRVGFQNRLLPSSVLQECVWT